MNDLSIKNKISGYIPALDGVRGYAVLAVMLHHLFITKYFEYGWIGVQVFFVLSGFLISTILINSKGATNYFQVFYMRRFLRIFPIYYLALLVILLYTIFKNISNSDWYQYILYIQNFNIGWNDKSMHFPVMFNHTWSLAVEEQFYLFWPLIIWLSSEKVLTKTLISIIIFSLVFKIGFYIIYPDNRFNYMSTFSNLDSLASGALLAVTLPYFESKKILKLIGAILLAITSIYILFSYFLKADLFYISIAELASLEWLLFYIWLLPLIVLFIVYVITAKNFLIKWIFCNPIILYIGKISYGLYLFHYIIYHIIDDYIELLPFLNQINIPVSIFKITISFAVAIISWSIFEQKILSYKKFFSYKKPSTLIITNS